MRSLIFIPFLIIPCFSQNYNLSYKHPEYYLPQYDIIVTNEFYIRDSSYQDKYLYQRLGNTFVQVDEINNRKYVMLRQSSLYFTDASGDDQVMCLKYPLHRGKKWVEGNTINVEVVGTNETVQIGTHIFNNCLKILKTWPPDIVEEDPEESQPILEIYVPGRWLVARTTYPVMNIQQVQVGMERYNGQFKTYKSVEEKYKIKAQKMILDSGEVKAPADSTGQNNGSTK